MYNDRMRKGTPILWNITPSEKVRKTYTKKLHATCGENSGEIGGKHKMYGKGHGCEKYEEGKA